LNLGKESDEGGDTIMHLLKQKLKERQKEEEILWKHKYKVQWLKEGERNTKFFHPSMVHIRYINHITMLEEAHGNTILDHGGLEIELVNFYKELLSKPQID
jgi:hypothetical protein